MGRFRANQRHGFGMSTWPDGSIYIGFWKDGRKDGLGRMRTAQGEIFNDQWRKGKRPSAHELPEAIVVSNKTIKQHKEETKVSPSYIKALLQQKAQLQKVNQKESFSPEVDETTKSLCKIKNISSAAFELAPQIPV